MGVTVTPEAPRASRTVDELYRKHGAEVYRYAYGVLGNRPDAEDMTQSTFMNALRALDRGEQPRKPGNWLITIAHNVARERFRHSQARPTEVAFDLDTIEACPSVREDALSIAELMRALGQIPPAQRSALVLREFEGRPYAEIARILEITTGALETLLFRARRSLAEELENVVTCERAEQDLARLQDGSLARKDRRRLDDHLRECASCARLRAHEEKPKRPLRHLAWLPLWFPLNVFRSGGHKALATAASHSPEAAAGASGGGLAIGAGLAAKVAAVVVTTTVAGGIGYAGVQHTRAHPPARPAADTIGNTTRHTPAKTRFAPQSAVTRHAPQQATADRNAPSSPTAASAAPGTPAQTAGPQVDTAPAARVGALPTVDHATGKAKPTAGAAARQTGKTAGKSAIAPGSGRIKTSPPSEPDPTTTTPDPTTVPGRSGDAPGTLQSDSVSSKPGTKSAAGNGTQSPKK